MLEGAIGRLPPASRDANGKGLYESIHGAAPDIAGRDRANPLAMILSVAMMFRHTFSRADVAERIEAAVRAALRRGLRTADIAVEGDAVVGTQAMGDAVVAAFRTHLEPEEIGVVVMQVGFIGCRGMVVSVRMQRLLEERDFVTIEPVFL